MEKYSDTLRAIADRLDYDFSATNVQGASIQLSTLAPELERVAFNLGEYELEVPNAQSDEQSRTPPGGEGP